MKAMKVWAGIVFLAASLLAVSSELKAEETKAENPWNYSTTSCYAYTDCYDHWNRYQGRVWCKTYGYAYSGYNGSSSSSCSWRVIPNYGVDCRGFQQVRDYWGNVRWQWNTVTFKCPGRT